MQGEATQGNLSKTAPDSALRDADRSLKCGVRGAVRICTVLQLMNGWTGLCDTHLSTIAL